MKEYIETVDSYIRWYCENRITITVESLSVIEYRVSVGLSA